MTYCIFLCYFLKDVLTDLKADAEQIPVEPPKEEWTGHKVRA